MAKQRHEDTAEAERRRVPRWTVEAAGDFRTKWVRAETAAACDQDSSVGCLCGLRREVEKTKEREDGYPDFGSKSDDDAYM